MNPQPMSKSQRRKKRLIDKGIKLGEGLTPQTGAIVPSSNKAVATNPPRSRRRRARAQRARGNRSSGGSGGTSDYVYALMNPEKSQGAKIPDMVSYPSSTFQLEQSGDLTVGATAGDQVGIRVLPLITDGSTLYPIVTFNSTTAGSMATATNLSWTSNTSLKATYNFARVVSLSLEVFFIGPSTEDQGVMIASCNAYNGSLATNFNSWSILPETTEFPARNGCRIVWKPLDISNLEYIVTGVTSSQYGNQNYYIPQLMVAINGQSPGTTNYRYHIVANFEAIPNSETFDIVQSTPSPYNESQMKRAIEWVGRTGNNVAQLVGDAYPYASAAMKAYRAIERFGGNNLLNQAGRILGSSRSNARIALLADKARGLNKKFDPNNNSEDTEANVQEISSQTNEQIDSLKGIISDLQNEIERLKVSTQSSVSRPPGSPYSSLLGRLPLQGV